VTNESLFILELSRHFVAGNFPGIRLNQSRSWSRVDFINHVTDWGVGGIIILFYFYFFGGGEGINTWITLKIKFKKSWYMIFLVIGSSD
jgi:hypothetical protein